MGLYCDIIRLTDDSIKKCIELQDNQTELYSFIQNTDPDNWFELDKAWHGIHFIISSYSAATEAKFLLNNGTVLRDYNWEEIYGVSVTDMRLFISDETKKIHSAINIISDIEFQKRYDSKLMIKNNVYPHIWNNSSRVFKLLRLKSTEETTNMEFISYNFSRLKSFIQETSEKQMGIAIKYHQ
ncbi:MAG: DUF1877 family protein [Ignavibacteria bacterium]